MTSEDGRDGHSPYRAYANTGLESLAAEASRRAESMDLENASKSGQNGDSKSGSRDSGPKQKVRKAYTITKQRERWTEDEHDRFLQALKRYGRAWRKIEEHIGTKTAVQIRSHAQKFFSKLQREQSTNGGDESSKNDINIPPPRPKRKPMHPYPRNTVDNTTETNEPSYRTHVDNSPRKKSSMDTSASARLPQSSSQIPSSNMTNLDVPGSDLSMNKVLRDAAMAAANAWSQVVANAGSRMQQQIQSHQFDQPTFQPLPPLFNLPTAAEQNDSSLLAPLLLQLAAQQQSMSQQNAPPPSRMSAPAAASRNPHNVFQRQSSSMATMGDLVSEPLTNILPPYPPLQTGGSMFDIPETANDHQIPESDRDSACSKERARHILGIKRAPSISTAQASRPTYWSSRSTPSSAAEEARLGRSALEMMQRASKAFTPVRNEAGLMTDHMRHPSTGIPSSSRRIIKPSLQSPRMTMQQPNQSHNNFSSGGQSDTSQMAHFYQRAAKEAQTAEEQTGLGENRLSGNGDIGSSRDGSTGDDQQNRKLKTSKSEKDSNNSGSDEDMIANGSDDGGNGSNDIDRPDNAKGKVEHRLAAKDGSSGDLNVSLGDNGTPKAPPNGFDLGSNNGNSASDEDANANGSDGLDGSNGQEGKGSDDGSNCERDTARQATPPANKAQVPNKSMAGNGEGQRYRHIRFQDLKSLEPPANLSASQPAQPSQKSQNSLQANLIHQMIPALGLNSYQQQALSAWAASNLQAHPQQLQLMQTLLGLQNQSSGTRYSDGDLNSSGFSNPGVVNQGMANNQTGSSPQVDRNFDRRSSCIASMDTASNQDCSMSIPPILNSTLGRSGLLDSRSSAPVGSLHTSSSGFKPYNKRSAPPLTNLPPSKRLQLDDYKPRTGPIGDSKNMTQQSSSEKHPAEFFTPFGLQAVQANNRLNT